MACSHGRWTAVHFIEDDGLQLDGRMVDLLPASITDGLHVLSGTDHAPSSTVEHLLSHTSGLPDYYEEGRRGTASAQARLLAGQDAPMPFEEVLRLVRDELTPHFAPQQIAGGRARAHYADTNYQLLGAIIERVTGERLANVFATMIFDPLGLVGSHRCGNPRRC